MGSIRGLRDFTANCHLLLTNSSLADMYVYDSLRKLCNSISESIVEVSNRTSFMTMLELVNMQPLQASRWLFVLTYKPLKGLIKKYSGIFSADTSCFLIKVDNYKDYKECKEVIVGINDIYLSVIRFPDVQYLLNGYKISPKVVEFVAKSYFREPEKVFMLREKLAEGEVIDKPKQVIAICGESTGTIARFAMSLLADPPSTTLGLKKVYSNRIKVLSELIDTFTVRSTYNFLLATVKDMLDIKILYLSGVIYDSIRDLPEAYDEKRLSRYSGQLRTITERLEYNKIVWLYIQLLGNKWLSREDAIAFVYAYYLSLAKGLEV